MTLASTASGLAGFLIIFGLIASVLGLWMFVLTVGFLRSGRQAFHRYLDVTDPRFPPPAQIPPEESPHAIWNVKGRPDQ